MSKMSPKAAEHGDHTSLPVFPRPRDGQCPLHPTREYEQMLAEDPFPRVTTAYGDEATLITRHKDVVDMLSDRNISSDAMKPGFPKIAPHTQAVMDNFLPFIDPPVHTALRGLLNAELSVSRVEALRPRVAEVVDEVLTNFLALPQPADLIHDFAFDVTSTVLCELVGVPFEDIPLFHRTVQIAFGPDVELEVAQRASAELTAYIDELIAANEKAPSEDTAVGRFIINGVNAGVCSRSQLVTLLSNVMVAGFDTTAETIGLGTLWLLSHPDQLEDLKADPALVPGAVEEILRVTTAAHAGRRRVAAGEICLKGGLTIREGEGVIGALDAANRDPAVFEDPWKFDIRRPNARRHLAFNFGPHVCAGAPLARVELQTVFSKFFARVPTLRLAVPLEELQFRTGGQILGIYEMPVTW